jgi:putative transposase
MLKLVHEESEANATGGSTGSSSLLDQIVRDGARQMLAAPLEVEVAAYVDSHADQLDEHGRRVVVRNVRAGPAGVDRDAPSGQPDGRSAW